MAQQQYPRIDVERDPYQGHLDLSKLKAHSFKIPESDIRSIIAKAIEDASAKSSREMLNIPTGASKEDLQELYVSKGIELFKYFRNYYGDPAATAHQIQGKDYKSVGIEQFRSQSLQKERMNSGWRYQFLATAAARSSKRFISVSDIGAAEADFLAQIEILDSKQHLNLYVSVKNRQNTLGGQDWPKAILALENVASSDKNRRGPYCCIFGIAMEGRKAKRRIPKRGKDGQPHSGNTEIWFSNLFWPFFSNYTFEEMMQHVLTVLMTTEEAQQLATQLDVPAPLLEAFGQECKKAGLVDQDGIFNDPQKLVTFFCA